MSNETRYVVRRADGKYLVIVSTMDRRRFATWIDNIELATSWPFMTGATLAMGLDLDPCLQAERGGWDVVPVPPKTEPKVITFSVTLPALLLALLFALVSSPVHAEGHLDWKPYAVLAAGQFGGDFGTTEHYLVRDGVCRCHCRETNPHLGPYPSTQKLVTVTAVEVGVVALSTYLLNKSPVKWQRLLGKGLSYGTGVWGGYTGAVNVIHCR